MGGLPSGLEALRAGSGPGGKTGYSPEHRTRLFSLPRLDSFYSFFSIPNLQPLQVTAPGGCMARKRCKCCRCLFTLTKRNPDQMYCSKPDCQKARKRRWQKMKMLEDEAYRLNQKDAQRRWTEKTPDYWKNYRENNPDYTLTNRKKQQRRNRCRRATQSIFREFAKMDALSVQSNDISGVYGLISVQDLLIAKMDAKIVKITEVSNPYA